MHDGKPWHPGVALSFGLILVGFLLGGLAVALSVPLPSAFQLFLGEFVIILPAFWYLNRKAYPLPQAFRLQRIDRRLVWLSVPLGLAVTILMDEVDRLVGTFVEMPPELEQLMTQMLVVDSVWAAVGLFLAAVVLAAIVEEMLFRGLLLQALEARFEYPHAILISALIFAFLHFMPWWIQILLIGVVLGVLAWRSDSVWPGIVVHAINNGVALLQVNLPPESLDWYNWNGHVYPPLVVASAATAFYCFKAFFRLTAGSEDVTVSE